MHNDRYYKDLDARLGGRKVTTSTEGFVRVAGGNHGFSQRELEALSERQERKSANNADFQRRMRNRLGW